MSRETSANRMNGANKSAESLLPEGYLRKTSNQIVDVEEEKRKLVIFSLGGHFFAFPGGEVKEILPPMKISLVPGVPEYFHGIINVRGDIESVINLHRFLGFPDEGVTTKGYITIVEKADVRSGILVDKVQDVVDVPDHLIQPPLQTHDAHLKDFIQGEILFQKRNISILDLRGIFSQIISRMQQEIS